MHVFLITVVVAVVDDDFIEDRFFYENINKTEVNMVFFLLIFYAIYNEKYFDVNFFSYTFFLLGRPTTKGMKWLLFVRYADLTDTHLCNCLHHIVSVD